MTEQTLTPIYIPMEESCGILEKARSAHEKYLIKQQAVFELNKMHLNIEAVIGDLDTFDRNIKKILFLI